MSGVRNDHVVLDALRQTTRCNHCRAEAFLPGRLAIGAFVTALNTFEAAHADCPAQPAPAPTYVRTAPGGAALKRDDQGLWWDWQPSGQIGVRPQDTAYLVRPVPLNQAHASLRQMTERLSARDLEQWSDDATSLKQAQVALESEGAA